MNSDKWKAHIEAYKFVGPTVKVLQLDAESFAVLDHEYNLKAVVSIYGLAQAIALVEHPPRRERPAPVIYKDLSFGPQQYESISTAELDL